MSMKVLVGMRLSWLLMMDVVLNAKYDDVVVILIITWLNGYMNDLWIGVLNIE